jgi:zinc protease
MQIRDARCGLGRRPTEVTSESPAASTRRLTRSVLSCAVAVCTWMFNAGYAVPAGPTPAGDPKETALRTTLDNGLTVVLKEDHTAPVVALNVWVRVGSADERADEAGMAHVFEHMLFKGTERRAVGEIARTVETAGGDINAYTFFDETVYHITMASRDVATGIDVLADAVQHSTFDADALAAETEVIVEEILRAKDSADRALSQAVFSTAYAEHPYRLPVIGSEESVRSFTREKLIAFLERWYVPNNMTFVAVGDFDAAVVLSQIETAFKSAVPRNDLDHPRRPEPEQTAPRAIVLRDKFEQTLLGVAWPITGIRDTDTPPLDLLAGVLGGSDASRLHREIVNRRELAYGIYASSFTPVEQGLFFVDAQLEPESVAPTVEAIAREIERLAMFGPSAAELERARTNMLARSALDRETVQGQARKLGVWQALAGGIEREDDYLAAIRVATPDDVRRVAQTYLSPTRATVTALVPQDFEGLTEGDLLAAIQSRTAEPPALTEDLGEGVLRYVLPNGLRVLVRRNPKVELVAMRLSFLGGLLAETEKTQGISRFVAEMLEHGTETRSAAEMAAEVESIAGDLSGFSGRNSFGISAEWVSDHLETGLELWSDMLLRPKFDEREIEKVRADTSNELVQREDHPDELALDLVNEGIYGGHPYRLQPLGTNESLAAIDEEALESFYARYATPTNGVLAVVGDVDPDRLIQLLTMQLADWQPDVAAELPPRALPSPPTKRRELSLDKGREQTHIVIGFPGLTVADADGPALDVLTQVLSGQGGRLFLELRDRQSLAYSVTAFASPGLDPGSWGVYIACAPDKREQAVTGLMAELRRTLEEPILDQEIERARRYLIGTHAVSRQRFGLQASMLSLDELYGLGPLHDLTYPERIEAVAREDVERVARRIIQIGQPVVAVVK